MRRARVAIATCQRGLELDEDRFATIDALGRRDFDSTLHSWDDPAVDWSKFDLVIIRSTWDYTEQRSRFLDWAFGIRRLANPFDVIEWNTDKRYLGGIAQEGVATVPTTWIEPGSKIDLPDGELVVKPAVGAGALGSGRYGANHRDAAAGHVRSLLDAGHTVMVQPYLDTFEHHGEHGLVYLGDRYSHAIYKPPLLVERGPFVVGTLTTSIIQPAKPTDDELAFAEAALDLVPGGRDRLLYARIDIVQGLDGAPLLVELEATEPHLYFLYGPGSADRFAFAVEDWLERS